MFPRSRSRAKSFRRRAAELLQAVPGDGLADRQALVEEQPVSLARLVQPAQLLQQVTEVPQRPGEEVGAPRVGLERPPLLPEEGHDDIP